MELLSALKQGIDAIIRPPRREYNLSTLPTLLKTNTGYQYVRFPLNFVNSRNQMIVGSLYKDASKDKMSGGPCVIYIHGNASSQMEGLFLVPNLCQYGISVYLYDCAGCGQSEGDFISLGLFESHDLKDLLNHLETSFHLGPFILWGRSMGASTSIMTHYPSICGIIADSTFSTLSEIVLDVTDGLKFPKLLGKIALFILNMAVHDCANFNISDVCPIEYAKKACKPPIIFGHAFDDSFIPISQARAVYNAYSNLNKSFIELSNGHNGQRSYHWYYTCYKFIFQRFNIFNVEPQIVECQTIQNDSHFDNASDLIDYLDHHGGEQSLIVNGQIPSLMIVEPLSPDTS